MPQQTGRLITDATLDRLAHRWLADVWAEQPKASESKSRGDVARYGTLIDWLLEVDDDASAGDSSGD